MAIEEVGHMRRDTQLVHTLTPYCRSSALRSPTRRPMLFTAVCRNQTNSTSGTKLTRLIVNQAVEYILSQPDGKPARLEDYQTDF